MTIRGILHENSLGYWLATTPRLQPFGAILVICEDEKEVKNLIDSLHTWETLTTPQRHIITWVRETDTARVLEALNQSEASIIVATNHIRTASFPTPAFWKKNCTQLELQQNIRPADLIKVLEKCGYEPAIQIYRSGQVAQRGNLIDIGHDSHIIRLEFDGNSIISISSVDTLTQDPLAELKKIILPPLDWPTTSSATITDFCHENVCLVSRQTLGLPREFILDDFHPQPDIRVHQTWPDLSTALAPKINVQKLKSLSYQKTYWLTSDIKRAQALMASGEKNITYLQLPTEVWQQPSAFIDQNENILVINDSYFFSDEKKSTKHHRHFLPEIAPGDLIVHRDHGVGRLTEFTSITLDDIKRDYLILEYADKDKIYLPTEQAAKISKYIGPANPKISRLSSDQGWLLTIQKIKADSLQLALSLLNTEARRRLVHCPPMLAQAEEAAVRRDFTYVETPSQQRSLTEILSDLEQDHPTERLLCGDVGFGKTEVALRASWRTVLNNGQVALLCPTTLLAQQHFDLFQSRLEKYGARIGLLSRWQSSSQQAETIKKLKTGLLDIVIGTHRALSTDVHFSNLRLLIIDEEQNFGVKDKEKLKKIANNIHILSLSATPIPRTLHLALSPLKNISLLTEPPSGRQSIITTVEPWSPETVISACGQELSRQGQLYYLHNKVETINLAADQLRKLIPQARIGIAHGQMEDVDLARTMHDFDRGDIDILVCSTIITNGLDLPNVNTIIVTDAANFGLSQLHQLRGRVGRSDRQAYCYLLHKEQKLQGDALERLRTLAEASELGAGFRIASRDMELRGVGQIIGRRQHGHLKTIGLNLYEDILQAAVNELKHTPGIIWRDIDIDLPLDQSVQGDYFSSDSAKIYFWQEVSMIQDEHEWQVYAARHEQAPAAIHNVLTTQLLRIKAQKTAIEKISYRHSSTDDNLIEIVVSNLSPEMIKKIIAANENWIIRPDSLKIKKSQLGSTWIETLQKTIEALSLYTS